ncbi:hypothetical protein L6452_33707 [Arctium lappa]|uniref:Uncharacterized protein n=1 Tax=Arctium lappa TaxID=4217 RepID=A0ACB8YH44_ARCLA|nr:hypothetical protein L6452_33707 [Arctium lappa]
MADYSSFTFFLTLLLFSFTNPTISVQPYDPTPCTTSTVVRSGSTYTCTTTTKTCNTYLIYRPQLNQPLSAIATLFNLNQSQLHQSREIVVPIVCDCPDSTSRAVVEYTNVDSYTARTIACGVYQGLVNPQVVVAQQNVNADNLVKVPVKCACTDTSHEITGTEYLVTYPVMDDDTVDLIAWKFGVTQRSIQEANGLGVKQTIFGGTTLLVPATGVPVLNFEKVVENPNPQDMIPVNGISKSRAGSRKLLPLLALIVFGIISLFGVLSFFVFVKWKYGHRERTLESVTGSEFKRFSPDFLDGMSKLKHILTSFGLDELRLATQDFSESSFIGKSVYKGRITTGSCIAIEDMGSIESAHRVVHILTKINHFNVVKLEGCCFDMNRSFLVFEFAKNGSLRDCLNDPKTRKELTWPKRVKIAFDVAEALHYIHSCTKPTYVHRNINTKNVLITADWRAKITGFKLATPIGHTAGGGDWTKSETVGKTGYLSPEYLDHGWASTKVDVDAYGIVLLELLSAKVAATGRKWSERVGFLADGEVAGDSPGCLEKFKVFMDEDLEGEYDLGDAMCLALLAKCCILLDDHQNRPTMSDVLKALSRILSKKPKGYLGCQ